MSTVCDSVATQGMLALALSTSGVAQLTPSRNHRSHWELRRTAVDNTVPVAAGVAELPPGGGGGACWQCSNAAAHPTDLGRPRLARLRDGTKHMIARALGISNEREWLGMQCWVVKVSL